MNKYINRIIFFAILITSLNCNKRTNDKPNPNKVEIKKEKYEVIEKVNDDSFYNDKEHPCKMPRTNERYAIIEKRKSLIKNQNELVIKLCENGNNNYALSLESMAPNNERGEIYDYKTFNTDLEYLEFFVCPLEDEQLYYIFSSSETHSKWRIKEGKLIELDKNKEFPCIDYEEMPYE